MYPRETMASLNTVKHCEVPKGQARGCMLSVSSYLFYRPFKICQVGTDIQSIPFIRVMSGVCAQVVYVEADFSESVVRVKSTFFFKLLL